MVTITYCHNSLRVLSYGLIVAIIAPIVPASAEPARVRDLVVAAIEENYSQFNSVQGTIEYRREDSPQVQAAIRKAIGGATDRALVGPHLAPLEQQHKNHPQQFLISGDLLRFDGAPFDPNHIVIIEGNRHIEFNPGTKHLQIQPRSKETQGYRDPRQPFFNNALRTQDVLLDSPSLVDGRMIESPKRNTVALEFTGPNGNIMQLRCPKHYKYLPANWESLNSDATRIEYSSEIYYQEHLIDGKTVLFPGRLVFTFWGEGESGLDKEEFEPGAAGWRQKHIYEVKDLKFNASIPESQFQLKLPDGTHVVDLIASEDRVVGVTKPAREKNQETQESPAPDESN